jgi:hypothetical protein
MEKVKCIIYVDKCRYEIREQKEVPVRYTGIYRPISSTLCKRARRGGIVGTVLTKLNLSYFQMLPVLS